MAKLSHNLCAYIDACEVGNVESVKEMLKDSRVNPGAQYNRDKIQSFFHVACQVGNVEVVKLLLNDSRVDPGADNNYAIRMAALKGDVEVVKLLLVQS